MNKHQLNVAMVRAGIDLDKLHKLTPTQLYNLKTVVICNEKMINAATQRTRQHMATPLFKGE